MWLVRGGAALSVLVLAACGGSEPRGHLSVVPRPELTAPPGEMAVRLLFTVSPLAVASGDAAKAAKWGTLGLFEGGVGMTIAADFRNAAPGTYQLKLLDEATCSGLASGDALDYVDTIESEPVRFPAIAVSENGEVKREYSVARLTTSDVKGRSLVLFNAQGPVACGSAIAGRRPLLVPERKRPEGSSSDGGRPGDGK